MISIYESKTEVHQINCEFHADLDSHKVNSKLNFTHFNTYEYLSRTGINVQITVGFSMSYTVYLQGKIFFTNET